jgi:hypothetical protein
VNTNLLGVSVHEHTHLWINENRGDHKIEPQTMEAICKRVASKLAQKYKRHAYMRKIETNTYTEGRVGQILPLVNQHGLSTLLRWVSAGKGEKVTVMCEKITPSSVQVRVNGSKTLQTLTPK